MLYKKVLLRERKRHTDRGVSSTPSGYHPPRLGPTGVGVPKVEYLPPPQQGVLPGLKVSYFFLLFGVSPTFSYFRVKFLLF